MNIEQAEAAIIAKMRSERPTLRAYLRQMGLTSEAACGEWRAAGALEQSAYRSGMAYAYRDIERMIEQDGFTPEPTSPSASQSAP